MTKLLANPLVRLLLRSPLNWLVSRWLMLVTVRGRKSSRRFTLPVQYVDRGTVLYAVSRKDRAWWRNLSGGAPVELRVRGRVRRGLGEVVAGEDREAILADVAGSWLEKAIRRRPDTVLVRFRLDEEA